MGPDVEVFNSLEDIPSAMASKPVQLVWDAGSIPTGVELCYPGDNWLPLMTVRHISAGSLIRTGGKSFRVVSSPFIGLEVVPEPNPF